MIGYSLLELLDVGHLAEVDLQLEWLLLRGSLEQKFYHLKNISNCEEDSKICILELDYESRLVREK